MNTTPHSTAVLLMSVSVCVVVVLDLCGVSESPASCSEACRAADAAEAEAGRGPRQSAGVLQVPTELQHQDVMAERHGAAIPERSRGEGSPSRREPARD